MLIQTALVALGATLTAAVQPLVAKGNYFVNPTTGNTFQLVGAAYQPGGSAGYKPQSGVDPLSNKDNCLRDAALMQILGVNAIRVYNIDPDLNHDECASIFNAAGMYMLLDVNSPLQGESINSAEPWTSYYAGYLNRTFAVVEAFKDYPNTLAFFSGNEVISNVATGGTVPPYVRAVTRDLKTYIGKHSSRSIPVGYSAADVREVLFDSWNYFQCAENGDASDTSHADLFALNSYSWCADATFTSSGYDTLVAGFTGSSVPVFYSEYGCNTPSPRVFTEVPIIYSSQMTGVFSGGIVYEFAQEANNFGLVNISSDGSATLMADFTTFKNQLAKVDWTTVQGSAPPSGASPTAPTCKSSLITTKGFNNNFTLPVLPPGAEDIINNGVSPKPVGKIVSISSYDVKFTVKAEDGTVMSGLAVKALADDTINQPGANNVATSTSSSNSTSTPSSSSNSTNAGERPAVAAVPVFAGLTLAAIGLVL